MIWILINQYYYIYHQNGQKVPSLSFRGPFQQTFPGTFSGSNTLALVTSAKRWDPWTGSGKGFPGKVCQKSARPKRMTVRFVSSPETSIDPPNSIFILSRLVFLDPRNAWSYSKNKQRRALWNYGSGLGWGAGRYLLGESFRVVTCRSV